MRGRLIIAAEIAAKRAEENQFGQPAGGQPGKSASIRNPAKSETSISI